MSYLLLAGARKSSCPALDPGLCILSLDKPVSAACYQLRTLRASFHNCHACTTKAASACGEYASVRQDGDQSKRATKQVTRRRRPTISIVQARMEVEAGPGIDAGQISWAHESVDDHGTRASLSKPVLQLLGKVGGCHAAQSWCHLHSATAVWTWFLLLLPPMQCKLGAELCCQCLHCASSHLVHKFMTCQVNAGSLTAREAVSPASSVIAQLRPAGGTVRCCTAGSSHAIADSMDPTSEKYTTTIPDHPWWMQHGLMVYDPTCSCCSRPELAMASTSSTKRWGSFSGLRRTQQVSSDLLGSPSNRASRVLLCRTAGAGPPGPCLHAHFLTQPQQTLKGWSTALCYGGPDSCLQTPSAVVRAALQ